MLIAELVIPQMFSAYAEDLGYRQNGLHHVQYFCEECDQAFCSAWGRSGSMGYNERGNYFTCPHCGHNHHKNVVYIKRDVPAPNKIRLAVKEYKDVVSFEVSSETVVFTDYLHLGANRNHKESFRFDIAKQKVTFTVDHKGATREPIEIGNPFKLEMFDSLLRYFLPCSLANSKQKSDLNNILKVLRETVHRKLEKHLNHKISSMFVNHGTHHGTFLLPILNIAYRLACPDAQNLPPEYRKTQSEIRNFWKSKRLDTEENIRLMDHVIDMTRRKKDFVTELIKSKSLPDRPMVRRTLREDLFSINILDRAFKLCENYDCAIRMYEGLKKMGNDERIRWSVDDGLLRFLRKMKPIYGELGIVRMVEGYMEMQLWDCESLFQQLNAENKKALIDGSVRMRDLHDWMSLRHKRQTHRNLKFDVPDHIVKRLSMQTDRLKFFMPKESMELLEAGHTLHNCVASYGQAMKDNSKWIVLVADDKGKLAVCLEIKGNEVVQAKTNSNRSVSGDKELNRAVIAWAKEANLEIKTTDIRVKDTKEPVRCSSRIVMPA